jgi:hypothetical protein
MSDPASWDNAFRRITAGEPVQDVLEERDWAARDQFRQTLMDMGDRGRDALATYDAAMRDLDLGITTARATWDALSPPQRRALREAAEGRQPVARIATLRNLERRGLIAWDGGAFDPEAKTVITERATFVLKHARENANG